MTQPGDRAPSWWDEPCPVCQGRVWYDGAHLHCMNGQRYHPIPSPPRSINEASDRMIALPVERRPDQTVWITAAHLIPALLKLSDLAPSYRAFLESEWRTHQEKEASGHE